MKILVICLGYFHWHYTRGLRSLFDIWQNFLVFIFQFFSVSYLIKNFFDTWKRMSDPYPKSFSFKDYLLTFLVNLIARIVGMIMRAGLLIISLLALGLFCLLLPVLIIGWLVLPFLILGIISSGLYLIFTSNV